MFYTPSLRMSIHHFTYLQTVGGLDLLLFSFLLCSMLELSCRSKHKSKWQRILNSVASAEGCDWALPTFKVVWQEESTLKCCIGRTLSSGTCAFVLMVIQSVAALK